MRRDVTAYIQQCHVCAKTRLRHPQLTLEARSVEVWEPFESVSIDFIGPLPADAYGNDYIVTCIDNFTRFVELFAVKNCSAFSAARALVNVFARYGAPLEVRSDQGPHFTAEILRQFLALCDVRQRFSLAYHPQANGIVERAIQEVNRHLRAIVTEQRIAANWSDALPLVQRIINGAVHSATGVAPATLLYGTVVNLDRNLFSVPAADLDIKRVSEYLSKLIDLQNDAVQKAQRHQAEIVDARLRKDESKPTTFSVGSTVLLRPPHDRPLNRLAPRFLGPYKVIEKTGTNSYKVRPVTSPDTDDPTDVHAERMIPFRPSDDADPAEMLASDRPLEYLVEEIRRHRRKRKGNTPGCFEYLVKWVGYDEVSWEPAKQFKDNSIFNNYLIANDIRH